MRSLFTSSLLLASAVFADGDFDFTESFLEALYGPDTANQIRGCYTGDFSIASSNFVYNYRYAM